LQTKNEAAELESQITVWHRTNDDSRNLARIPGIGPLTASALVASVGDARTFKNGRQLAAWLGLVPRQHSSGGKSNLLGISKRGDAYLRTLLIHGARSAVLATQRSDKESWLTQLLKRCHTNVAAVALANKNARILWAVMTRGDTFDPNHLSVKPTAG